MSGRPKTVETESAAATEPRIINTGQAIREGLEHAAVMDPSVIFFAEGVDDPSAVYGTLAGIGDRIGADRMIEMPIAENALCGVAIGAAMTGKRPVISFHRVEFALLAMEQIVNNAAKAHYVSNGQHRVPLVLRLVVGRGWGQGPEHSQSLESVFAAIPGLKVVMPVYPADAKGMMIAAVQDDNPVISIESRWVHYVQGDVPDDDSPAPLDGPRVLRAGGDITIAATSYMVLEAMRAADELASEGVSAEVIDLRVLRPLNVAPIVDSVRRTGHLMTIDAGFRTLGLGAEVTSRVVEACFDDLKRAPVRQGLPDHPVPSSRGMIPGIYPNAEPISRAAGELLGLAEDKIAACAARLRAARGDLPVDVPDQYFRGPF